MAETKRWWKESVVYQIYPRSFNDSNGDGIGDIPGITEKLDYLKTLGIDVIWLSPVYKSPNDDNGYDISDYKDIMDEFGTMADWETMLAEAHKRGLKVIMDLVVNHSSDEHAWFLESRQAKDNPYRDYYIWRPGKEDGSEPNNWESAFSGSAWEYDEKTGEYYLHLFSKKQPDLNWENPTVRSEVHDMMKWWLDKGVDGFRMDVINFISKEPGLPDAPNPHGKKYVPGGDYFMNGPRIHEFLHEMYNEVLRHYDVMTVGEMPGVDEKEAIKYTDEAREELNMVFQFEHVDLDSGPEGKWDIRPLKLEALRENLVKWQKALEHNGWNSLYWNNHDQPRVVSRFGNDRDYHYQSATMLATLLHMMKGTPYIYQGEEFGMTNVAFTDIADYNDIETLNMYHEKRAEGVPHDELMAKIHIKGRDNARTPVQWDDSRHAGFTSGEPWLKVNPNYPEVNAEAALNDPKSIFYYYQKLIELRHSNETVVYGSFDLLIEDDPEVFAYKRELGDEMLLVYCNFYNGEPDVTLPKEVRGRERELFLANREDAPTDLDTFTLRPYEAVVYRIR
ncbi:glycoside hydrolase family 13 protein [Salisediminibacterium halotolerans]|uniref:oligo-1,6-glucosidase n=1 Tax=Salisediminibacterium halotolerans TaxID=517425 RepID=A0A1H9VA46_9BACI|nr:alpha-glucosidase [Salisediminibacterium haloalkalitolerans]SES18294.1 oligo-1,6-glucosidase [Salisediminibacterium haloalkalitolerans]